MGGQISAEVEPAMSARRGRLARAAAVVTAVVASMLMGLVVIGSGQASGMEMPPAGSAGHWVSLIPAESGIQIDAGTGVDGVFAQQQVAGDGAPGDGPVSEEPEISLIPATSAVQQPASASEAAPSGSDGAAEVEGSLPASQGAGSDLQGSPSIAVLAAGAHAGGAGAPGSVLPWLVLGVAVLLAGGGVVALTRVRKLHQH